MPETLSKAADYRAERRNLAERMQEILDAPAGEDGRLNSEQETEFDRLHTRQNDLKAKVEEIEAAEARERAMADLKNDLSQTQGVQAGKQDTRDLDDGGESREQEQERAERYTQVFDAYLRYGLGALTPESQNVLLQRHGAIDTSNMPAEVRAMGVAQDTKGGFFVPEGFHNSIVEARKNFGGMRRSRATILSTSSGQPLPIPTDDDTSNVGAILPENNTDSEQDLVIGQVMLNAYMYTSKIVKVSRQLLQDSAFDVQAWLSRKLAERIGRITNQHFTSGDAASKPQGLVVGATSAATAASTTDFTVDELYDLKHAVDPDYREMAQWMFADATLKALKKKKDGEGRPLWQSGIAIGEPDSIDGDPYVVNQDMPSLASGNKPIAYGDFSLYYIRDVLGIQLLRLDERYADALQVGFLAFSRHDGVLVDAGQNPIQVLTLA